MPLRELPPYDPQKQRSCHVGRGAAPDIPALNTGILSFRKKRILLKFKLKQVHGEGRSQTADHNIFLLIFIFLSEAGPGVHPDCVIFLLDSERDLFVTLRFQE